MQHNQRAGLLYAAIGFILLSCGDAVTKTMAGQWAPTAISVARYVLGAVGLAAILAAREGRAGFVVPMPKVQLMRGAAAALATAGFFTSIFLMPLSEAASIILVSPMITALLAALFLGEPVRCETVLASLFAFAGVLVILRPNFAALGWAALLPLFCAAMMSLLMIGNRAVSGRASALAMQFFLAASAVPILLLVTLAGEVSGAENFAVSWPDWTVLARCAVVACSATAAHFFIYLGTTRAGAATVAPMTYVQLIVALALGWALFGERPDAMALIGAAMIVAAGLFLWRQGRMREPAMTD